MIKVNEKDWDKLDDKEKMAYCDSLLEDARSGREKRDLEWFLNYMFEEGNHYLSYNTSSSALESNPPPRRGEVRMVINKIRSAKRAIQNYATASKPKWEITPQDTDPDTVKTARQMGKVMDYLYNRLRLEATVAGVVDTALSTSVGWVEVDWDPEAEKGQGQVRVRLHDPFDIWIDKRASLYAGRLVSRFVGKTISRSLEEIKFDKRYDEKNRKLVTEDEEVSTSQMKAKIIKKESGTDDKVIKRGTVKEFMLWDDEKNSKKGRIQLFTYGGGQVLIDEPMKEVEYPIYCFQISMNPLKVYQRAWVTDAIPLNKALDRSLSQKIMYMNQALVFRIITEKGHGAGVVSNEMGEFIEINKGRLFQQMTMQPVPFGFDTLAPEISTYIEDTMGAHDAAMGRMPEGARSGKTLEAIQAADANNLTGLTQSLESFLAILGEKVLDVISEKYVTSRVMKIAEPEEGQDFLRVTGEKGRRKSDSLVLTSDNEVMVKIGSWLGHTKEAQRETLLKLVELQALPTEEVLRQFEFPNVEDLSAKARDQRMEQGQMDLAIAGHAPGAQGAQPAGPETQPGGVDMKQLADKESMAMMQGQQIPSTEGADMTHTQAHVDFMKSQMFGQATPEVQAIFKQHVAGEMQNQGMGGDMATQQAPVQQPPMAF
jgi:hypothetical protein